MATQKWRIRCPRCKQSTCVVHKHFCHRMRCSGGPCEGFEAECSNCDYPSPPGYKRWVKTKPSRKENVPGIGAVTVTDVTGGGGLNWDHPIEALPRPFNTPCRCMACRNDSPPPRPGFGGIFGDSSD